jgi:hypothetical protein
MDWYEYERQSIWEVEDMIDQREEELRDIMAQEEYQREEELREIMERELQREEELAELLDAILTFPEDSRRCRMLP